MAHNNNGAFWLSIQKEIENPYYGAAMSTCGSVIQSMLLNFLAFCTYFLHLSDLLLSGSGWSVECICESYNPI